MMLAKSFLALLAVGVAGMAAQVAPAAQEASAAAPNPARGAQLFLQCRACHTVVPGGANTVGPNLSGIVGAKAATRPGYTYSPALAHADLLWTAATLDGFLERPSQAVPGTKMGFAGIADPKARADLIAYLATLKGTR